VQKQAAGLSYAVRSPVLAKYFGQLCLVVAVLTVVPLAVSLIHGETPIAFRYAIVIVALAGTGGILGRLPAPLEVQVNEAMVLVAFMFLVTPLVMSFPDAVFEAVSAATTTGLSTVKRLDLLFRVHPIRVLTTARI
jgi:trk system potassium uptake protein TrkH